MKIPPTSETIGQGRLALCIAPLLIVFALAGNPFVMAAQAQATNNQPRVSTVGGIAGNVSSGLVKGRAPVIAATAGELANLITAWESDGEAAGVLRAKIGQANKIIAAQPMFPAGGGQDKHRYMCKACEAPLKTVDDAHHKCSRCGKVYSGEPYDNYIYLKQHRQNFKNLMPLALAWRLTGRKEYSDYARALLLGYAERYATYPYHHALETYDLSLPGGGRVFPQSLTEAAVFTLEIAPAYDLIRAADSFSDADLRKIEDGIFRPLLMNIDRHKMGKSNWQTWHNAALFAGGALLGDKDMMSRSIADQNNGFDYQMRTSISTEGCWYENSWAYHYYALSGLIHHAEYARRAGVDLWAREPLRKMALLPYMSIMPNGELPRFGDDPGSLPAMLPNEAEAAWRALDAPELAPCLPREMCWETIMYGRETRPARKHAATGNEMKSLVLKETGYAILRTRGPGKYAAAITAAPHGPHGHFDKLSFTLFGHGRELGVDPGRAGGYDWPIHLGWYKATLGHNAVTVDGQSQLPARGAFTLFGANDDFAALQAVCDTAYPGVEHTRSLILADRYLVVVDKLKSALVKQFHWNYHNVGEDVTCANALETGEKDPQAEAYVKNVKVGVAVNAIAAKFRGKDADVGLHVCSSAGRAAVLTGLGPGPGNSAVPFMRIGCSGDTVVFAGVVEALEGQGAGNVHGIALVTNANAIRVKVDLGKIEDVVVLDEKTIAVSRNGKEVLAASRQME